MKVLVLATWDKPKSEEGLKKLRASNQKYGEHRTEKNKKHNVKSTGWTDGTGKVYWMTEFESYEAFAKYMDDEEDQIIMTNFWRNVKNGKIEVLRGVL